MSTCKENIEIRRMAARDLVAVKALCRALVDYVKACGQEAEFVWDDARIRADLFGPSACLTGFVACRGDQVVGYTLATSSYEVDRWLRQLEVLDFFVLPECRGQRVGKRLLAANAGYAREIGAKHLCGLVYRGNTGMQKIYRHINADLIDDYVLVKIPFDAVERPRSLSASGG